MNASKRSLYSEVLADWRVALGHPRCCMVAGGGWRRLMDGCRKKFKCVPVLHNVTAVIAHERFNERGSAARRFPLTTTGAADQFNYHRFLLITL